MADNVTITQGTGTSIATDDIGGIQYQRVKVSLGADGVATDALGGAGAVAAGVQRTTLASDDPAVVALQIIDDWDESDRARVNLIVGQAGVAAAAGAVDALTQRVVHATDDPGVTALQIIDDWDEADRARVNVIVGQPGISAGAGAVAANTPRVTHASDDPAVTSLAAIAASVSVMDDWDETDRARVNVVVGQAGITAGAGAVAANTPRVTHASDDPAVTRLNSLAKVTAGDFETVAASQTNQILGPTGAVGDFISHLLVVPTTTSPGVVTLLDGATSIPVFAGGASSLTSLIPFPIPLQMVSASGSWRVTTGAGLSVIAVGDFT